MNRKLIYFKQSWIRPRINYQKKSKNSRRR